MMGKKTKSSVNQQPVLESQPDVQESVPAVPAETEEAKAEKSESPMEQPKSPLLLAIAAYVLAFCIPSAIALLMYKIKGVAPFGEGTVLCMDLWGQYAPMYAQLARGETLADLFYSWNGAFGYNNWAQSAYYCNSIFLLPLRLISMEQLVNYINWVCLLKFGCAGASCLAFLRYKTKSTSPFLIGGASAYSLCAYMLAFISQPMWTDCLIYAPLILVGMERMLHEKKPLMYTLMLALTICSSFYIGFAICIFCCLYFVSAALPTLKLGKRENGRYFVQNLRNLGMMTGRFSAFSILGGAIAAPVILPIAQAVSLTIASESTFPEELKWYGNFSYIFRQLLSEQPLCVGYTGVNLFIGMIVFLLLPLYFLNKQIPTVQRAVNGAILLFLTLSLNCNFLDFLWHGFHFPNQLPGRWSFLFSLFSIMLICTAFVHLKGLSLPRALGGVAIGFLAAYTGIRGVGDVEGTEVPRIYLILMAASAAILLLMTVMESLRRLAKQNPESHFARMPYHMISALCATALTMLCITDSGMSFIKVSQLEEGGTRINNGTGFTNSLIEQSDYGSQWVSGDDDFYRIEANSGFTFNPSMIGGYHGMGYYSSTMRGNTYRLLQTLGNRVYANNVSSVYLPTSPVQNSLFGVRYFIDYARTLNTLPAVEIIETDDTCDIVENQTALSVAYGASRDVLSYEVTDQVRAIENQNTLLSAIVGEQTNVFRRLNTTLFTYENAVLSESANWNSNYFERTEEGLPVKFHYVYNCDTDGAIYLEHNFRAGTITVTWDGGTRNVEHNNEKFAFLGNFAAGTEITIDVQVDGIRLGCVGLNLYSFDEALWNSTYEKLSAVQLDVTKSSANCIEGTVNMPQTQLLMTTIPQDGGWKAYCDGEPIGIELAADELICVLIPKGEHTIEFKYHVPLLGAGIAISLTALVLCIWFSVPALRKLVFAKLSSIKKS